MDRVINVRMFSVETKEDGGLPFSAAFQRIAGRGLADREKEVEPDIVVRLEQLDVRGRTVSGEIVRLQTTNLPPKALRGRPLESLGVRAIGHTAAFVFDTDLSVLALQITRNGLTTTRIALYAQELAGGPGYDILPVPNEEIWAVLRRGGVRGVTFRVASPNELQAIDDETRSVRRGVIAMKESLQPAQIEISMTMKRGDVDIDRRKALSVFGWLQRERQEHRGGISKIAARVVPEQGDAVEILNLIGGHMGGKDTLDLPDDDPQASYRIRSDYIQRMLRNTRRTLEEMYG